MSTETETATAAQQADKPKLTRKDFMSDQDVRWCPGCGDYAILTTVQNVMPMLGVLQENIAVVSGIGCSSRFPYYMNTYGFHSIHGRAPAVVTGLRITRPDITVWLVTGDGDGLSIGGNHMLHILRRNINCTILLFNNRIYGLTKGQASPTSLVGQKTKSTPQGAIDNPINPISIALAAEATFIARTMDTDPKHMRYVLEEGARHQGTSFIEIYQNCVIFNDGAFKPLTDRNTKSDNSLFLESGKPLIYGKDRNLGIKLNGWRPEVAKLGESVPLDDIALHDESSEDPSWAYLLSRMDYPEFPVPFGIFRRVERPVYEDIITDQVKTASEGVTDRDFQGLLTGKETWTVGEDEALLAKPGKTEMTEEEKDDYFVTREDPIRVIRENIQRSIVHDPVSKLNPVKPCTCSPDTSVADAIKLLQDLRVGCVVIPGDPIGIFTERDVLKRVIGKDIDEKTTPVKDLMTTNLDLLRENDTIAFALNRMAIGGYRHIPVVDSERRITGIVSIRVILQYLAKHYPEIKA